MKFLSSLIFFLVSFNAFSAVDLPALMAFPEAREKKITSIKKNKILVFLSRTCPCTQQNIPYLNELAQEFPQTEFIGIHSVKNSNSNFIAEILSEYKPVFSIVDDKNLLIADLLKANRTPQAIILNEKNEILYSGGVTNRTNPKTADKLFLHNALVELSQNKPITEKETRSLGCVILR